MNKLEHRVDRVLGFFSSRPNWDPQPPHPQASVPPPILWFPEGRDKLACGTGGANSDEGTDTVVLQVFIYQ